MKLEEYGDQLVSCKACGTCSYGRGPNNPFTEVASPPHRCPSLDKYGFMAYGPRGRLYLARLLQRGEIPIDKDLMHIFFTCTECGMCEELCFHPFRDIIKAVKIKIVESGLGPPENIKQANQNILEYYNPFGKIGLNRTNWANGLALPRQAEVMLYVGCRPSYREDELAKTTVALLRMFGIEVGYLSENEWCCGRPADWEGQTHIAEKMAVHNVEAFKAAGAKTVLFTCPGCYQAFKNDYPEMIGEVPFEVMHIAEYLPKLIKSGKLNFKKSSEKIAYHDPCQLGRYAGIYDEPREVITSVPGVELVEMERNRRFGYCCGSGADFADWVSVQRLEEVKGKVDKIITSCPKCVQNLSLASRKEKAGIAVESITTYLINSLE